MMFTEQALTYLAKENSGHKTKRNNKSSEITLKLKHIPSLTDLLFLIFSQRNNSIGLTVLFLSFT